MRGVGHGQAPQENGDACWDRSSNRRFRLWMLPLRVAASFPSRKFRSTASLYEEAGFAHGAAARLMARQNLEFSWGYYVRLASLLSARQRTRLGDTVRTDDHDRLTRGLIAGPGLILVSAHLGDFEIAGAWLAERTGHEVVAVVETVNQRTRQLFFDATRRACGIRLRRAEETKISDLEHDLLSGRILVLMLDRRMASPFVPATLFGLPAEVSVLPYVLSCRTGAAMMAAGTVTSGSGARQVYLGEPLVAIKSPQQAMQEVAHDIDALARLAPEQWHVPADPHLLPLTEICGRQSPGDRVGTSSRSGAETRRTPRTQPRTYAA